MPFDVHCTACGQKLRVPDSLLGRTVRCAKCQAQFKAEEESANEVEPELEEADEAPSSFRRRLAEDEDDNDREDDYEPRRKPRRRRKRRRDVGMTVQVPAWLLLATSIGGGLLMTLWLIFNLLVNLGKINDLDGQPSPMPPGMAFGAFAFWMVLLLIWCGFTSMGAVNMLRLRGLPLAITGCIIAMLPCSCGCLVGLPIGIWGLIVLVQTDVQKAFD
jgi:uncharacterized Zn finger protein (UPF0148 family)